MTVTIIQGDARQLPLPDASVDLVVTSPPYFGLRSYKDGGEHYAGQIGSEPTPAAYLDALIACTAEWVRVLKPDGSIFVNLGDSFSGGKRTPYDRTDMNGARGSVSRPLTGMPGKCLLGIPWRYALAVTDQLGLILRAEIIWAKPNGLPESVTDRVRRAHEQVFHFTRQPRYYSAVDEIREQYAPQTAARYAAGYNPRAIDGQRLGIGTKLGGDTYGENPLGKLPGSVWYESERETESDSGPVWSIPSQPLTVPPDLGADHFAAFPMELPRRIILGWSPPGVCTACGQGRRPVAEVSYIDAGGAGEHERRRDAILALGHASTNAGPQAMRLGRANRSTTVTGYACACPEPDAPTRPAVVLDPFGGTGTTALIASVNGRHGITVDRSADYCRIAAWRTTSRQEIAAAMQVDRPARVPDDQGALFAMPP